MLLFLIFNLLFLPLSGVSRERSLRTAFKSGCQSGSNNCKRNPTMRAKCGIESRNESSMGKASKKQAQPLSLSSRETTNGKDMFQSTSSSVLPSPTPVTHNLLTSPKVSRYWPLSKRELTSLALSKRPQGHTAPYLVQYPAPAQQSKGEAKSLAHTYMICLPKCQHTKKHNYCHCY